MPARHRSRHIALFTTFLFRTTPSAQASERAERQMKATWSMAASVPRGAALLRGPLCVPLEMLVGEGSPEFVEPVLVVHHLGAAVAGHRVLILEEYGLLRAHLFAEPAVYAPKHVDVEGLRRLLHLVDPGALRHRARRDPDRLRRAHELAELARDALLAAVRVLYQRGDAAVAGRYRRALLGVFHRLGGAQQVLQSGQHPAEDLREVGALRQGEGPSLDLYYGHGRGTPSSISAGWRFRSRRRPGLRWPEEAASASRSS